MLATYLCIGICAIIWIVSVIWIMQAVKEHFSGEIYPHMSLGIFFTLLALELTIGIHGALIHFGIFWLTAIGWIFYIPSVILVFGSIIGLKQKGKTETYNPSYTTTLVGTSMYDIISQPITLGMTIWSIALILVFQSNFSIVLGISIIFCRWMSARKEAECNTSKFGENMKNIWREFRYGTFFRELRK